MVPYAKQMKTSNGGREKLELKWRLFVMFMLHNRILCFLTKLPSSKCIQFFFLPKVGCSIGDIGKLSKHNLHDIEWGKTK